MRNLLGNSSATSDVLPRRASCDGRRSSDCCVLEPLDDWNNDDERVVVDEVMFGDCIVYK